ncbi:DUF2865 domain-containing protein [Aquabacter cavernae]|uniref:DUF2865 domain-containing protein n=1 Tax=Aquabacter cavernae TaxID=2496029 RepID=UPI000F8DA68C|nr:DUF2865 domain-containing protein [Aquabacter cavernae]
MRPGTHPAAFALAMLAGLLLAAPPAAAQGPGDFFAALFGGLVRPRPLPQLFGMPAPEVERAAPRVAYCVRLCDGRYFPLTRMEDAEQTCRSFCPKAETRVYRGAGAIDAAEHDGRPYTALPNAFLYRARLDDACTCTGNGPLGLASVPVTSDETLRPGDVVMTTDGARVFQKKSGAGPHPESAFVPPEEARRLPADLKRRMEELNLAADGTVQAAGNTR